MFNIGDEVRYKPEYLATLEWIKEDDNLYWMTWILTLVNKNSNTCSGVYSHKMEEGAYLGDIRNLELVGNSNLEDWL